MKSKIILVIICIFVISKVELISQTYTNPHFNEHFFYSQSSCIEISTHFDNLYTFKENNLVYIYDTTRCENQIIPRICCMSREILGTNDDIYWEIFEELGKFEHHRDYTFDSSYISIVFYEHGVARNHIVINSAYEYEIYFKILMKYFNKIVGFEEEFMDKYYYHKAPRNKLIRKAR